MTRRPAHFVGIALACGFAVIAIQLRAADQPDAKPSTAKVDNPAAKADTATSKAATAAGPAAPLDGVRWEFPCKGAMPENPTAGANCDSAIATGDPKKTDNFTVEKKFGGEAGKHYKVTLRFRGVVEPMKYKSGQKDGDLFYIGGEPDDPTYNIYELRVSSPAAHYYLNRQDATGHRIFTIDYQKTIEIDGGATLTIHGDGQNGLMISNFLKLTVPDVPPFPKPFNGQFIQANVIDVVEAK